MDFYKNSIAYAAILSCTVALVGCGSGGSDSSKSPEQPTNPEQPTDPETSELDEPKDPDFVDIAPIDTTVKAYVDYYYTNKNGDVCNATLDTNAGIRLAESFLDIWQPSTLYADAGKSNMAGKDDPITGTPCPAILGGTWDGSANTGGTVLNAAVHKANIEFSVNATNNRTKEQERQASIDQAVHGAYLVTEGMGPVATQWRTASGITGSYSFNADGSVRTSGRVNGTTDSQLGKVVLLVDDGIQQSDNDVAKIFYKYARPYLWDNRVKMAPGINYTTPSVGSSDFVSGHTVGVWRRAASTAYAMPERFQEVYTRAMEHGQTRVWGGAHTTLATFGGRMSGLAITAANLYSSENPDLKESLKNSKITAQAKIEAREQALRIMQVATGIENWKDFYTYLHSGQNTDPNGDLYDRFADHDKNKKEFEEGMNYGMADQVIYSKDLPVVVPKGAEVLLETRYPYLSAAQRRVVLKTTAFSSGYPVMTDKEGWGRLNMFAAGDGYGQFNGLVTINMNKSLGNFAIYDIWRNNIFGQGKLVFNGDGTLVLAGQNTYSGGTVIKGGTLEAASASAFGSNSVHLKNGAIVINAKTPLEIGNNYRQYSDSTLEVVVSSSEQAVIKVKNTAKIEGGTLRVKFAPSYKPTAGTNIKIISANKMDGEFSKVEVEGWNAITVFNTKGYSIDLAEPQ